MREQVAKAATHCRDMAKHAAAVPLVFLGVGLYRAWLATFFRYDAFPGVGVSDYFLFEAAIGVASLALAFTSRSICPLWANRAACRATTVLMTLGACAVVLGCFVVPSALLKAAGLIAAGAGLGSLILMWAEFYGSINPVRVALYHGMGIFAGEALKWLFMGLDVEYLVFFSIALPVAGVASAHAAIRRLARDERPRSRGEEESRVLPWKAIAIMAACSFAAAFGALPVQQLALGNVAGSMTACAFVCIAVLSASRWFNFDTVYQLAFPLFIVAFLFVSPVFAGDSAFTAASYDAGYTMLTMFMVIVFGNMTYRFGVNAVWACGIERGIRYGAELCGWGASSLLDAHAGASEVSLSFAAIALAVAVLFAVVFFSERGFSAQWGIAIDGEGMAASDERWLMLRVVELSRAFDLSPREGEVLTLMAERKTVSQMEKELFVAQGTIKAHISHVYKKLGVHSRAEVLALFDEECS